MTARSLYESELRADLQRVYGIDWDEARAGAHTVRHVAALVACLPADSCVRTSANSDAAWGIERQLLAGIYNSLNVLIWGMGDPRRRGAKPRPVGPSWMTKGGSRSLETRAMTPDELMRELAKPRSSRR